MTFATSSVGKGKTFTLNTGPVEGSWAKACSVSVKKMSKGVEDTVTSNQASLFEQEETWMGTKEQRVFSLPDSELFASVFRCYRKPSQDECASKGPSNRVKRHLAEWEEVFANHTSDKELASRIYAGPSTLNNRKTNNPVKK